ncbi:hypothetical protein LQ567_22140 [Niabella pedocola]|uniref:HTH OST-type domain-containing protein n=1 Tax=Niabella pedocola TaxID=1752077 RepID=A0ABS8PWQ2_9BACT|nr:hypothetical protein [Niabella pedocola]MCD2425501.1 hypothetical protein [Niabella pedocola]
MDNITEQNLEEKSEPKKVTAKKVVPKKGLKKRTPNKKAEKVKKASKPTRTFPIITVEKCLVIAQKLKEKNGGNPWSPSEVRKAIEVGDTNKFFYISKASKDFGFTYGTRDASEIGLTDFGRSVVYAPNPETEKKLKIEGFLKVEIFREVLNYYKGSQLPEMKYLSNTLEDKFKLAPEFHEEFSAVFSENCKELGINNGNPLDGADLPLPKQSTILVGEAKRSKKANLKAFVIMPFVERHNNRPAGFFKEVLDNLLIPAGIEAGFDVETANKQGSDVIQSTIINDLLEADLVIADLTDHNPNVLFELGLRMANDLPIALIKSKDTGRIFDVDNMLRVYEYNQNLWKSTIENDIPNLIEHFKAVWTNKDSEQTYMKILRRVSNQSLHMVSEEKR